MHITMFMLKFLEKTSFKNQRREEFSPDMAQSKALAVKDHHHSGHLGPLLLHDQLEQGEDTGEEVEEGHLEKHMNWEILDCFVDLLWWPLAKSKYNNSSAFVVAHFWTEDQVSPPDVLQDRRRAGTHIRIVVLDHLMRARYQTGTNVHVPIAPAQKSKFQGLIEG